MVRIETLSDDISIIERRTIIPSPLSILVLRMVHVPIKDLGWDFLRRLENWERGR